MSRTNSFDAIVLHTYNVGDADRYCILFTRESGKIAARAKAVRKPKSKMGGSLLSLHRGNIQLTQTGSHCIVTGVSGSTPLISMRSITETISAQKATQVMLSLLHDDEPMPQVFDAFVSYLLSCSTCSLYGGLPFIIYVLYATGLMPSLEDDEHLYASATVADKQLVRFSMKQEWQHAFAIESESSYSFQSLIKGIYTDNGGRLTEAVTHA